MATATSQDSVSQPDLYTTRPLGTCQVCRRHNISINKSSGLLRVHGPRGRTCPGSHLPPSGGPLHPNAHSQVASQATYPLTVIAQQLTPVTGPETASANDPILPMSPPVNHPQLDSVIIKRIPKGARATAAALLQRVLQEVMQNPSSIVSWTNLLNYPHLCFSKPLRGGRARNLTTYIVGRVRQFESNRQLASSNLPATHKDHHIPDRRSRRSSEESLAAAAAAKLEDGDVKGAVRLLCSNDNLITPTASSFADLSLLHPPSPDDRRPAPTTDTPPLQTTPAAVRKAILSFPNGSAAGPDGLRPQHLKDLVNGTTDDGPLMLALTDFVNMLLEGKVPSSIRPIFFGANLLAISKKNGGCRPIAVGYSWRRLTAKVACAHVKETSSALLAPRQLGFGISGGAEAVVRAARIFLQNQEQGKVLVKIDFRNAFNTIRRDAILEAVARHFPELLPFATSSLESPSILQHGKFTITSAEGAQQGDPLGPFYFCLAIQESLDSLKSELILGYLDDITLGDDASIVIRDFLALETSAAKIGLTMNRSKCEVIGLTAETQILFASQDLILPETDPVASTLLGAPLCEGPCLDEVLRTKRQELELLSKRLALMPAHNSLFLLRNTLAAPRLLYLLRTAPCFDSPVLPEIDSLIRDTLSIILNVDLNDDRWLQAALPVRWGGLGVRDILSLAPSAYLASAASTTELISTLLPEHLGHLKDIFIQPAMSRWLVLASSTSVDSPAAPPSLPTGVTQGSWDDPCCKARAEKLKISADNLTDRVRLLAAQSKGSGDWLHALPLSSIGLKLDDNSLRIAAGLRLGASIIHHHVCHCGATVTPRGYHGLSCRYGSGKHVRHNMINDILCRAFNRAGFPATREPLHLCAGSGKRPDGTTLIPWSKGRCLTWDATCPNTYATSHARDNSIEAGSAALTAEQKKRQKYLDITPGADFIPVAIETSGVWGESAWSLVQEIGRRIANISKDNRAPMFLRQQLSIAIQRGNACCVLGTLGRPNNDLSWQNDQEN